ncbi:H-NS family nucleoid-associated regulatory protein [Xenophilus sp. Marseille-Q4582]|uniref:H-NS histone family protein n=1 Tax=Xenophilus sp. Marseille-Q4582 TaxID=2866600 RepID=UPI001CE3CE17|nr:H-NS histone family protein [Xenophilus sp. Marseille-Q4582]
MTTLAEINSQIQQHDEKIAELRKQAEQLRNQERAGVIEELRRKIAEYGITASDLRLSTARGPGKRSVSASPAKTAGAAKYRSPTGETWSGGRGRKPRWVVEALAAGKSLEEFEIQ